MHESMIKKNNVIVKGNCVKKIAPIAPQFILKHVPGRIRLQIITLYRQRCYKSDNKKEVNNE